MASNRYGDKGDVSVESSEELVPDAKTGFEYRTNDDSGFDYRTKHGPDDPLGNNSYRNNEESHGSMGFELSFLPPDQRPGIPVELLAQLADPDIEDDTEAAEALRANANVKVRKVGKVARSLNAQSVRKFVKRATLRGKSGNLRGKPPRIPPGRTAIEVPDTNIFVVQETTEEDEMLEEEDASDSGSEASLHDDASKGSDRKPPSPSRPSHIDQTRPSYYQPGQYPDRDSNFKAKKDRHSSILEEAKDIPAEVVAATMEAGRKCKCCADPSLTIFLGGLTFSRLFFYLLLIKKLIKKSPWSRGST